MIKIPYFDDLQLVYSGYFPRYSCRLNHAAQYWSLELAGAGALCLRGRDGVARTIPGPALWVQRPGAHYEYGPAPGHEYWEHAFLCIAGDRAERLMRQGFELLAGERGVLPLRHFGAVLELFLRIHRLGQAQLPIGAALDELLILAAEETAPTGDGRGAALEAERLAVIDAPGGAHTAQAAARRCGISTVRFRQLFAAQTGEPYHRFVLHTRLRAAANHLLFNDESLKEIADALHLGGAAQFNKSFQQHFGMPPGEFRRRNCR